MKRKKVFLFITIALLFNLFPNKPLKAQETTAPININISQEGDYTRPKISGLTVDNTDVLIYVDGIFQGLADVNTNASSSLINNTKYYYFSFQSINSFSEGEHLIKAISREKTSLLLSPSTAEVIFTIESITAPTLLEPNEDTITQKVKPLIKGLTKNNTKIHIFIDGIYNGKIDANNDDSGTANFSYKPFLNLNTGWHKAWAVAEDANGHKSKSSNVLNFEIEKKLPAPILVKTIKNLANQNKPIVTGLVKNDLRVRVFIDHKLNGEFNIKNDKSGTANFAYTANQELKCGQHFIYATAIDKRGKESIWSNIIYFDNCQERGAITPVAAQEEAATNNEKVINKNQKAAEEIKNNEDIDENKAATPKIEVKEEEKKATTSEATEKKSENQDISKIINNDNNVDDQKGGMINESKDEQGKMQMNLIIFIVFLLAVIAWIIWINRELIKDRKKQNEEEEKQDKLIK